MLARSIIPRGGLQQTLSFSVRRNTSRSEAVFSECDFESIRGISPPTFVALNDEFGYKYMTRVQAAAIPDALKGEDMFVRAPTGQGKTIAYLVPLIERMRVYDESFQRAKLEMRSQEQRLGSLKHKMLARQNLGKEPPLTKVVVQRNLVDITDLPYVYASPAPIGLILVPTRELGLQIAREAKRICDFHRDFEVAVFVGGRRIEGDRKKIGYMLNRAANMTMNEKVMICTPGRLLEHLRDTRGFKEICGGIKMMVVDESDRMLDMGFHRDVADILVEIAKMQVGLGNRLSAARDEVNGHLSRLGLELRAEDGALINRTKLSQRARYVGDVLNPVKEFDHQTLLFSATVSSKVLEIANSILRPGFKYVDTTRVNKNGDAACDASEINNDKYSGKEALYQAIRAAEENTVVDAEINSVRQIVHLQQALYCAPDSNQLEVLFGVLLKHIHANPDDYKVIVFTPTSRQAAFLSEFALSLRDISKNIIDIHSKMTQPKRLRASEMFRNSTQIIMFSSDVSARGMDYPDVTLVVQLGIVSQNQYTHRVGRTGRIDKNGEGALICTPYEFPVLQKELSAFISDTNIVRDAANLVFLSDLQDKEKIEATLLKVNALRDAIGSALGQTGKKLQVLAQTAATSWLGFYAVECNKLGWGKVDLVNHGKLFSSSMGLHTFPELTLRTIEALRLHETALGKLSLKHLSGEAVIRPKLKNKGSVSKHAGAGVGTKKVSSIWKATKRMLE